MDPLLPRQSDILSLAKSQGRVDVDGLASHFDVTPQTIRKDLNLLCDRELLERVHGGAIYPSGVANLAYEARRLLASENKAAIGQVAAQLIPDNSSLILNIGTTTEQVAHALRHHSGLMVITNNINVANILHAVDGLDLIIAGGMVRRSDGGIVGESSVDFIRQFKVDYAIIGTSAIDQDGSLLDFDYREVRAAKAIIKHARKTILVCDHMKFERQAPVCIAHLSDIDVFVTDKAPSEEIVALCETHKVQLVIAEHQKNQAAAQPEISE
ncbi:DeoR/GlpR family DNA-binding transcription regulator [Cohaesibacter gelatinilyticus]|uniref:Transcriptional regulator, DeoR family n=1 Tax=Cohaesibacter gelatinilyticus TaxID=372072 RepID=A0A285PFV9_9HYPH|nr:DeoR/GlpR family DNA-binding transcription regulator [Cohaesibacter gelatinilyticus]SNZ20610.1 transcriptional regulator, DeoR family [Cohaesibacter gelatinilyticus]